MTKIDEPEDQGAVTHARIQALIGAYPDLTTDELAELLQWYRQDASSYDVAMLSARDDIRSGYNRFYKDHIERISPRSWLVLAACCILLAGLIYGFATQLA